MKTTLLAAALLVTALPVLAEDWLEVGHERQVYDNDAPDADTSYVGGSWTQDRQVVYGELSQYRRFNSRDVQTLIGGYAPLTRSGQLHAEGSFSNKPDIKARSQVYAGWYQVLPGGWTVEPGVQRTRYSEQQVTRYSVNVERYIANWRLLYGIADVRLDHESSRNQRVQADYYHGQRNRIGVGYAWGDDLESLPVGVVSTPVQSLFLTGQYQLTPHVSMTWQVQETDQGTLYRQTGGRLGIRYQF